MGFFESLANGLGNMAKNNYKQATGRDYDRDFRTYREDLDMKYSISGSSVIRNEREKLRDDASIYNAAKKAALRDVIYQYSELSEYRF